MVKDIYLMHIDGEIAFYIPSKRCPSYGSVPQDKFIELIEGLREEYPEHRMRCIRNEGLESHLREKLKKITKVVKIDRER
jgi:hypothetical protein